MDLIQKRRGGEISQAEAQNLVESYWVGALRRAVDEGDVDFGSLMAGQSVGLVSEVRPLREALALLIRGADEELIKVRKRISRL